MALTTPDVADVLAAHGQEHLLAGVDELEPAQRERFLARLAEVDWEELARPAEPPPLQRVGASRVITLAERAERSDELFTAGEEAYRSARVAVLIVAGGQGTRLGFPGPKGLYPIGERSGRTIYELHAEKVATLSRRVGQAVPLLIMTSPMTDAATRGFFAEQRDFGLEPGQLRFFVQGTVPSLDAEGRALLAAPGQLLENPDGHGGCFTALVGSGELDRLRADGVQQIVYIQVDNILAPVDDPVLVGLAVTESADVVTKVLPKAHPDEKVGHLVRFGDRDRIVEYTELTPEDTRALAPDGLPIYRWARRRCTAGASTSCRGSLRAGSSRRSTAARSRSRPGSTVRSARSTATSTSASSSTSSRRRRRASGSRSTARRSSRR